VQNDKSKETIIITGASGFVGSHFFQYLHKEHLDSVFGLYNSTAHFSSLPNFLKVDITDKEEVFALAKLQPSLIIHCAAITNIAFCEENIDQAYNVNVIGTQNIAELAAATGAKLLYTSTDVVFDGSQGEYTEKDEPLPLHHYGRTKLKGERVCMQTDPQSLIIRSNVFGYNLSKRKKTFVENIISVLAEGKEYGAFYDVEISPIYIETFINDVLQLLENDAEGIFHVAGPQSITKYDFSRLIAEVFGYDVHLISKVSVNSLTIARERKLKLETGKLLHFLNRETSESLPEMVKRFHRSFIEKRPQLHIS